MTFLAIALFGIFAIGEGEPSIPLSGKPAHASNRQRHLLWLLKSPDDYHVVLVDGLFVGPQFEISNGWASRLGYDGNGRAPQ